MTSRWLVSDCMYQSIDTWIELLNRDVIEELNIVQW